MECSDSIRIKSVGQKLIKGGSGKKKKNLINSLLDIF